MSDTINPCEYVHFEASVLDGAIITRLTADQDANRNLILAEVVENLIALDEAYKCLPLNRHSYMPGLQVIWHYIAPKSNL